MNESTDGLFSSASGQVDDVSANAADAPLPLSLASRRGQMFPKLVPAEINRLRRFGTVHKWQPGELLIDPSTRGAGMFVLLSGRVLITRKNGFGDETPIVAWTG